MIFQETYLKDAFVVNLAPHIDSRGYFVRLFSKNEFKEIGFNKEFVQVNYASNTQKYTLRGFHFQLPPFCETKLIRCVRGKVQDYIVDVRKGSPTFLKSFTIELSGDNTQMLLVPEGFAHGYLTLEEDSSLIYFHSMSYTPGHEGGLRFDDPVLGIEMPAVPEIVSEKDMHWPYINETHFTGIKTRHHRKRYRHIIHFPHRKRRIYEPEKHYSEN
jgi:dTDP-4-dehydrorhamnose 3,5-epimerase